MAEWSIAAVLKTVVLRGTGGSNPSLSAKLANGSTCLSDLPLVFLYTYPTTKKKIQTIAYLCSAILN